MDSLLSPTSCLKAAPQVDGEIPFVTLNSTSNFVVPSSWSAMLI